MGNKDIKKLEEENRVLDEALYWACNYIVQLVDKDVNCLTHEWAENFIKKAKENIERGTT